MKVALLIRGITFFNNYIHHTGKVLKLDYRTNIESVIEKVVTPLIERHDVFIYIASNSSCVQDDVIRNFTQVKNSIFLNDKSTQNDVVIAGLNMIETDQQAMNYDLVIITRFDLELKQNITDIPIEHSKINILWEESTKDGRIADCLFFFHGRYIRNFLDALINDPHTNSMHNIKQYLCAKDEEINFIYHSLFDSNSDKENNPVYVIKRGTIIGDLTKSRFNKYLKGNKLKLLKKF